jgi:hypothetical protein
MSKTNPPSFNKSSIPPPPPDPLAPVLKKQRLISHGTRATGVRECMFTTVKFALEARSSAWDTLRIEIDEHNGAPASSLLIRGQFEASEMPGQLRWLADAIALHGDNERAAVRDHVTFEKSYGGGA